MRRIFAKSSSSAPENGKPLRIKMGMDPTAPDVTLGHAVPLKVIRQFQEWGHKAVLIIGDYTARVGDPSGRNKTRPVLDPAKRSIGTPRPIVTQVGKVLLTDPSHLEVRHNGEWLRGDELDGSHPASVAQDDRCADASRVRISPSDLRRRWTFTFTNWSIPCCRAGTA